MLVQCPKCKTTYKVSDDVIKGTSPAFRCSRCKYTFELEMNAPMEPVDRESPRQQEVAAEDHDERELSFTFGAKNDSPEEDRSWDQSEVRLPRQKDDTPAPSLHLPAGAASNETSESWSMSGAQELQEKPFIVTPPPVDQRTLGQTPAAQPPQASAETTLDNQESADNIFPIHTFRDQAVSTVPYLTLFGLLVIFFSLGTAYLEAHPKVAEDVVRRIPLIGPSVVRNGYLKNGVLLKSLHADYQTIMGNREVLVVRGEALNQNPVVIRELRVVGRLYNESGKTIERQVIWVGNALSPKIIRGMSAQDISDLQRLKPLKSFEVPPGDSISFAIVFLRPAKEVKDFGCEVLSAEGEI